MLEKRIVRRVPFLVIHAVENPEKPGLPLAQQTVQAAAKFLRRDFARVTRADRGDHVGKGDSGLEAVQLPVKFRAFDREIIPAADWSAQRRRPGKSPDRRGCGWSGRSAADSPTLPPSADATSAPAPGPPASHGHAPVRPPRQITGQVRDAFGKENEPLRVVRVTDVVFLINPGPLIKFRLVDEIDRQARVSTSSDHNPAWTRCAPSGRSNCQSSAGSPGNRSRMPRYSGVTTARPRGPPAPAPWPARRPCPPSRRSWSTDGLRCWPGEFSCQPRVHDVRIKGMTEP